MCHVAPNPAPLQGRAPVRHVSYSSESCLPAGEGSGASCVLRFWILPPYQEASGASTACPTDSCGLRNSNIKKSLSGLPMQLDSSVPNASVHVSMMPNVRAIMGLQDVRVSSAFNAYKTCGQAATVQRRPC
jgi:hypothetical protein